MKNNLASFTILASGLLFALLIIAIVGQNPQNDTPQNQNVRVENGKQIIDLTAKGGYSPRVTLARAGIETVLRVKTNGTYDCSSAMAIPELQYRTRLAPSGITEIDIPAQAAGKNLRGLCSMGMYHFAIKFN